MLALAVPAFALEESDVEAAVSSSSREAVTGNVLVWFLCAVGFLKVSQKIDSFMASIGVNVGHTGGSMLGDVMVAFKGVSLAAGAAGKVVGNFADRAASHTGGSSAPGSPGFLQGGLAGVVSRKITNDAVRTATQTTQKTSSVTASAARQTASVVHQTILMQPDAHSYFLLDGSFPHFYYLTNDRYGEATLRLLCDAQQRRALDAILADGLHEGIPNWRIENDAIDSVGNPVLFAYTCDFPRIRRFDTALELHGMTGALICFDYQEEALREICGQRVILQSIDFQQFERSVLYS